MENGNEGNVGHNRVNVAGGGGGGGGGGEEACGGVCSRLVPFSITNGSAHTLARFRGQRKQRHKTRTRIEEEEKRGPEKTNKGGRGERERRGEAATVVQRSL